MSIRRWLPGSPLEGIPFSFGGRRPHPRDFAGGAATNPDGRLVFVAPGILPEGWRPGAPPRMDPEAWCRLSREIHAKVKKLSERARLVSFLEKD